MAVVLSCRLCIERHSSQSNPHPRYQKHSFVSHGSTICTGGRDFRKADLCKCILLLILAMHPVVSPRLRPNSGSKRFKQCLPKQSVPWTKQDCAPINSSGLFSELRPAQFSCSNQLSACLSTRAMIHPRMGEPIPCTLRGSSSRRLCREHGASLSNACHIRSGHLMMRSCDDSCSAPSSELNGQSFLWPLC